MVDSLTTAVNHKAAPIAAAGGSIYAQAILPPPHDIITTGMQVITFLVGVLPSIIQIFKRKKAKNEKDL